MHDLKLPFVYSEVCKVHYPIHLFTFVIVGGLCLTPWGTSRSINWGVDNITGGSTLRQFSLWDIYTFCRRLDFVHVVNKYIGIAKVGVTHCTESWCHSFSVKS